MEKIVRQRNVDKKPFLQWGRMIGAGVVYLLLSFYLYLPYLRRFSSIEYLFIFNSAFGALGCFVLSRRWVGSFTASLFAGAVYGFSPFTLSFAAFHPAGGLAVAMLSWLFIPAAYWHKIGFRQPDKIPDFVITALLTLAGPAVLCVFFFMMSLQGIGPFFPVPVSETMTIEGLKSIALPFNMRPGGFALSVYHIPLCGLAMGVCLYYASGGLGIFLLAAAGLCMSFYEPVAMVPPVVWALVPLLCCCVLTGYGFQGIVSAGKQDRWCILGCCAVLAFISAIGFIAGEIYSGFMTGAGAVLLLGMFFILRAGLRWHFYRWLLFTAGFTVDIISGARYILDGIFGLGF